MRSTSLIALLAVLHGAIAAPLDKQLFKRALPRLGGVNLAGCEFGIDTNGGSGTAYCPGTDQITHFVQDGANLFRLPVGWQYLVGNNQASTSLDTSFFASYDKLVQATLAAGAYAIVDVHNYARWNSGIVGQGGPTDAQFASLWSLLAAKYKSQPKVIFGIMNEPHDIDINKWATTVQTAVNAIRAAGATSQSILIPGNSWTNAPTWYNGGNNPLLAVTDPASTDKSKLLIDVHRYLDSDFSGTSTECSTNSVDVMTALVSWLSTNKRQSIISETGGGNTASCRTDLAQMLQYISAHSDTILGFAIWSAGNFAADYTLSIVPSNGVDNQLFTQAIKPYLPGSGGAVSPPPASSSAAASSTSRAASSAAAATTSRPPIIASSSHAATTTSATRSSSSAVVIGKPSTLSSVVVVKPSTSSSIPATSTGTAGNLQTYAGALGGYAAPAVTSSGGRYTTSGSSYNFLKDALNASCYKQMDTCQNAANSSGNKGDLTVSSCNAQQVQACLAKASSA